MSADPTEWVKASASGANGQCVEMRQRGGTVEVRDTKDRGTGPSLGFTRAEFAAWLEGAKQGEFDHLR
jgi:hypothetical protein